jgi:hypothetical protein
MPDFLIPLQKVDAAQRLVYGRIDETPDTKGQIFDYATSKPYFEEWSNRLAKATEGRSFGNVRVMHSLEAVGVITQLAFNDAEKAIDLTVHVVDDAAWAKCEAGVFTGFSPGGKYVKKWRDGAHERYTAKPHEMSLVDLPCIPSATFQLLKADGTESLHNFAERPEDALIKALMAVPDRRSYRGIILAQSADTLAKLFGAEGDNAPDTLAKRDFSAAERKAAVKKGEAMPDGSFPIQDRKDVEDAVSDYGRSGSRADVKAHIIERAKAIGATDALPPDWNGSTKVEKATTIEDLRKGMSDVSRMADTIQSLSWLAQCVTSEAVMEGDGSPIPKRICDWIAEGVQILDALNAEESQELLTRLQQGLPPAVADLVAATQIEDWAKGGGGKETAQKIHDHACELGAECAMGKAEGFGTFAKMAGDMAALREDLAAMTGERDALQKRFDGAPAAGGPRLLAVESALAVNPLSRADAELAVIEAMPTDTAPQRLAKSQALHRHNLVYPASKKG